MADLVTRYLQLGLGLSRHLDGMLDAYYGPADLQVEADSGDPRPLPALADDARQLLADLDAGDADLELARRRWIRAQVVGLHTSARKLGGEAIAYEDEVEWCYGVRPTPVPDDVLADAHRALDSALPGVGPLRDRFIAWRESQTVPPVLLEAAIRSLADDFRERTDRMFGLPEGETIDWILETDKPWAGFNYYLGGLHSRVAVNIDLPVLSTSLGSLVSHEAYPGHHTEHCRKEVGLFRRRGQLEESIFLVGTPQCLVAEGLADLGLEALLGDHGTEVVASHLEPLGIAFDGETVQAIARATGVLSAVRGNVALMLHRDDGSAADAVRAFERWGLLPRNRAEKAVQFLTDPTWRAYIFCYVEGVRLCRQFAAGDPSRYDRLLSEPLLPADLAA